MDTPIAAPAPPILASFRKEAPDDRPSSLIFIRHPFRNTGFLSIPVRTCPLSADGTPSSKPCIPLTALLDACYVVTGTGGILSLDDAGQQVLHTDLVEDGTYYYVVSGDPKLDYPIFHSFDEWVPPGRGAVPDRWFTPVFPRIPPEPMPRHTWYGMTGTPDSVRSKVKVIDGSCRLSRFESPVDAAHVVPSAMKYWFLERDISDELCYPISVPWTLSSIDRIHDVRNILALRTDIRSRWDDHAFVFIPVDGHFIAYYISPSPLERQAADFHCARLDTPERVDGYLLFLRFALAIFSLVQSPERISRHPLASRVITPVRTSSNRSSGVHPSSSLSATREYDLDEGMDDATAAKYIIDWYNDVDRGDLPDDLACAWRKYLEHKDDVEPDPAQLRRQWEDTQRRVREEGLYHDEPLGEQKT